VSTKPLDFSDLGATQVAPAKLDFSDLGGKVVSPAPSQPQSKGALDQLEDFGKHLWSQINPVSGLKGMAQATSHPVQTIQNDVNARQQVLDKAHEELSKGNYSDGAALWLYAHVPLLGAQLANAGEEFKQGKFGAGAGDSTGIGLNLAGPKALEGMKNPSIPGATPIAERMYQSALKPPPSTAASQVRSMVNTGLNAGIPVSEAGQAKLAGLIQDLGDKVKTQIASQPNATVNKFAVASRLGETARKFSNQVAPGSDLDAISKTGQEFLDTQPGAIPATDAQALKQGTYQQLKDRSYGELQSATKEAQKSLARGIKEELEAQFPEIKGLNAQQAKFYNLDGALERAVNRIQNRDLLSLGGKIAVGTGVGAATGGLEHAGTGAIAALALHYVMSDPLVQSRLAIMLNKAGKGAIPINNAFTRVQGYVNALGNSAGVQPPGGQPNGTQQ